MTSGNELSEADGSHVLELSPPLNASPSSVGSQDLIGHLEIDGHTGNEHLPRFAIGF